ncbi:MAG: rRNA maturation RNase YbeY [Chloroflexi bacterium]|nr:rRNA maturation RNase YbeY [Chloroflexota bacterium]
MPIHLDIPKTYRSHIETRRIESAAKAALQQQAVPADAELSIVITTDEQIQDLNYRFRGVDAPTDVLSFPTEFTDPESGAAYLGDVVISFPRAESQSRAGGHDILAELQLLIVHGILHLLGYDHVDQDEKDRMWAAQAEIIANLGVDISPP